MEYPCPILDTPFPLLHFRPFLTEELPAVTIQCEIQTQRNYIIIFYFIFLALQCHGKELEDPCPIFAASSFVPMTILTIDTVCIPRTWVENFLDVSISQRS